MAAFSKDFPNAYHVFPLHAAKGIWENGLLSKATLAANGLKMRRATTHAVDNVLGFGGLIHCYLPKGRDITLELSILQKQIGDDNQSPFPHAMLVFSTASLKDMDCTICNFNIAVSRPAYNGVKGGNHAAGTDPSPILAHWEAFRRDQPNLHRRRRGEWNDPMKVPTLVGSQITNNPSWVGYEAASGIAELLLKSPYVPVADPPAVVWVFSKADRQTLKLLGEPPSWLQIKRTEALSNYSKEDRVKPFIREAISKYFRDGGDMPELDFDVR